MPEFKLPAIGEGVVEGEIVRWLKQPGDSVAANEGLVEVMTDKATVEIPSPRDGVVERHVVPEGAVAAVGEVIAILGEAAASAPAPAPAPAPARSTSIPGSSTPTVVVTSPAPRDSSGKVLATPAARALARERGIDLQTVPGREGRITKAEVLQAEVQAQARPLAASSRP
ncbi:MAG: E3 binding domain-containing protein, partial [Myxococcales bacterium]|nr:E3 binding domain-containing protein [Myxococcales bacterium]